MRERPLDPPTEPARPELSPRGVELDARRALLALGLALAIVLGGFNMGRAFFGPIRGQDFAPYYVASNLLLDGHRNLVYDTGPAYRAAARRYGVPLLKKGAQDIGVDANVYPPTTTVLYAPFAALPYGAARIVFFLLSCAAAAAASLLLFLDQAPRWRPTLFTVAVLAAVCFFPLWYTLYEGQVNCVLWVLVVAGLVLLRRGRSTAAGAAIGIAALIKLFPAVLLIFLIVKRDLKALAAALAAAAAAAAVCLPLTGTRLWRTYVVDVLPHQTSGGANYRNQGFEGFFDRLLTRNGVVHSFGTHASLAHTLTVVCGAALIGAAAWFARRPAGRGSERYALEYALFLVVGVVSAPKSWEHYAVLLLPAFALVFVALFGPSERRLPGISFAMAVAAAVSYVTWAFLLQTGTDYASLPTGRVANLLFSLKFFASLILVGCLCALIRRHAQRERAVSARSA